MLATVDTILDDLRQGKIIILADDEQRENEGDMIFAAQSVTPELINFMMLHARGLICLTLTEEKCHQLQLPLMPVRNQEKGFQTAFTISIEAANGVTTGISASDRAKTIATAISLTAKPSDIVTPGHIFPLMAKPGGVLERPGHTEAGCDLTRLAGLIPAAVICEITLPDGSMARMPDLEKIAKTHNLHLSTVEELAKFRLSHETIIKRSNERTIMASTPYGLVNYYEYEDCITRTKHIAILYGTSILENTNFPKKAEIYTHYGTQITDWFKEDKNKTWTLDKAFRYFSEIENKQNQKVGIILLLDQKSIQSQISHKLVTDKKIIKLNKTMINGLRKQICSDLCIEQFHLLNE